MKIGELGKVSRTPTVTLRYYERIGLLPNNKRSGSNYRVYDNEDVEQLRFIKHCRNHQISIEDIKKLLEIRSNQGGSSEEAIQIINAHIEKMQAQIKSIEELISDLKNIVSANEDKKDGGKLVIETLGKPCPKCSDYAEKMKELAAKSAS